MAIPLNQYLTLLKAYLSPQWFQVLGLGMVLFSSIGLQILNPQLLGRFIDLFLVGERGNPLITPLPS